MFLDDLTHLLIIPILSNTNIMADLNINTEDVSNANTVIFNDTMHALGLNKYVTNQMHQKGNILDLIFHRGKL